jgi:cytochrome c553
MSMKRTARNILRLLSIVMALGSAIPSLSLSAPPAGSQPGDSDDLRAALATPQDIADGKPVAQSSCASCHGLDGRSKAKGVPHIAGQRPGYLYLELRAYKENTPATTRGDTPMSQVVKFLSDDALVKVAAYYASLEPAPPAAPAATKAGATKNDPVSAGKAVAAGCSGCHGEAGISKTPGMPSLVGQDLKYLTAAMGAYKAGQRKNDMMKTLMAGLSDTDMNNAALFYALQKPAKAQTRSSGDQAAGKAAAAACAGCHGEIGVSATAATPSLAGQEAQYLVAALTGYKDGSRKDETMKGLAAALDEPAMKNLAAFYANQQPKAPEVIKPRTTAEWVDRCDRCHGVNGNSTDPRLPAIAGQREDYLATVLHGYRSGTRKSQAMAAMSAVLSDTDVEGLAAYYARQKARTVVYVPLPGK